MKGSSRDRSDVDCSDLLLVLPFDIPPNCLGGLHAVSCRRVPKSAPDTSYRRPATADTEFPVFDVGNLYACVPIHLGPVFLLLNSVLLTEDAAFAVTVLMSPLDDMRGGPDAHNPFTFAAYATLALPLGLPLECALIDPLYVIHIDFVHICLHVFRPSPL